MFFNNKRANKLDLERLPKHVAFIMDGNGRWAKKRGMPRLAGHQAGAKSLRKIIEYSAEIGIPYITVYAFSTENWSRPKEEVDGLMKLLVNFIDSDLEELHNSDIRVHILGDVEGLPDEAKRRVMHAMNHTKNNKRLTVNIALNYGSQDELVRMVKRIHEDIEASKLNVDDLSKNLIGEYLYTKGQPDPDMLIRTSGEQRLSNFLLWQLAYTEFFFVDEYWPDFSPKVFENIMVQFQQRDRRFGKVKE